VTARETAPPTISIVTSLFNQLDRTKVFLDSLEETLGELPCEVILVDDASTDDTPEFLEEINRSWRVLTNSKNRGFAFSNNLGAKTAQSEVIAFLNNDLILRPGWLQPMLDCLQAGEKVGCVGNVQLDASSGKVDHAGIYFESDGSVRHARKGCRYPPSNSNFPVRAVTGACFIMYRELFIAEGGFDEGFVNGFEDIDLCLRLAEKGYQHFVSGSSCVLHHVGSARGRNPSNDSNERRFRDKWGSERLFRPEEWAKAYLSRFAGRPWRFHPTKALKAIFCLARLV
tara:strand:+ start:2038 stop:2892 length:855 start_codon:yes stop_codon:yes gene_type:complete